MKPHLLTILFYVLCTFAVQATSHFLVNVAHYAQFTVSRAEPIVPLGIASMLIQGAVLSFLFVNSTLRQQGLAGAVLTAGSVGAVVVSYIALAEYAKYDVSGFGEWLAVEVSAGAVQFGLIGVALWVAHGRPAAPGPTPA